MGAAQKCVQSETCGLDIKRLKALVHKPLHGHTKLKLNLNTKQVLVFGQQFCDWNPQF